MEEQLKTGTTTLGIVCRNGIILAADKRATAGNLIVDKRTDKIHLISEDIAVTIAGTVSDAQLLIKLIRAELKLKEVRTNKRPTIKEAANMLGGLLYSMIRNMSMLPAVTHFLLGGRDNQGLHLYDLFPDGSVTKIKDFVSSGSGSVFAYGVLESQYSPEITVEEGMKLAVKAVNAALQRDNYTGGGIDVVVITEKEVKKALQKEVKVELQDRSF